MEFDKNKIDQKLLFMDTCLNKLKKLRAFDKDAFIDDFTKVDSAKYLLQVSIEAMLDISSHYCCINKIKKNQQKSYRISTTNYL